MHNLHRFREFILVSVTFCDAPRWLNWHRSTRVLSSFFFRVNNALLVRHKTWRHRIHRAPRNFPIFPPIYQTDKQIRLVYLWFKHRLTLMPLWRISDRITFLQSGIFCGYAEWSWMNANEMQMICKWSTLCNGNHL